MSPSANAPESSTPVLADVLAEYELDTRADAGAAFVTIVEQYFAATGAREGAVSTPRQPEQLATRFDEPMPRAGLPLARVIARLERDVLPDCNRLAHPRSMGHQVSAPLPAAVWTEALTAALNQSAAVFEMSPVGTVLEHRVVRWMADLVGYGPDAGGTFTSGGVEATFAGLLAARHHANPQAWRTGVGAHPPVVVCGEHAHYGVARAVGLLGLGTDHIVAIASRGVAMDVDALERTLAALRTDGRAIMAVVATAGSTATGAFDDLDRIGRLCDEHNLWFHVDGAHGASALLSARHRHRVAGIGRARSLAWDPHKMMLLPLTASVVLVRHEADLEAAFSQHAPYLFHGRDGARRWDQGLRGFQCSRRVDALKVWVALQRYGADGLGVLYDHLCDAAAWLHGQLTAHPDFEALHEPESNILCFRALGPAGLSEARRDDLNERLRAAYNRGGDGWITTTVLGGRRVLRVTLMNPRTTREDLAAVVAGLASLARELA